MCDRDTAPEGYVPDFVPRDAEGQPLNEEQMLQILAERAASYTLNKTVEQDY